MCGAWALLKHQYGRLQCVASVGLMFRLYEACDPPTASYGCEIWGFQPLPQQFRILRKNVITSHLQMLKEITGVRGSTSTDILLAELGPKPLHHVWLLRAAKFWNNLAGKPLGNLYRCIALDCCRAAVVASKRNWAWSMFKAVHATGYELGICCDDVDIIDIPALRAVKYGSTLYKSVIPSGKTSTFAQGLAPVIGLDAAHRLDGLPGLHISTHARSLSDIPVSATCMKRLLRFRMGCHRLPRDEGSWARPEVPRRDRVCQLCGGCALGDDRHLVFECPELLCFREQWSHLFEAPQTMQAFMWQEDLIWVA